MDSPAGGKRNRLTLYIIIALICGISLGFVLNDNYVKTENNRIAQTEVQLKTVKDRLAFIKDTNGATYLQLKDQEVSLLKQNKEVTVARDKKLEPFSILADIFLRLIKMIVAPLVFTTLVVGVAKLGDIRAVGRIGGKTLLWFVSASLMSLLLGMIMVNLFRPGEAMHLPLPV